MAAEHIHRGELLRENRAPAIAVPALACLIVSGQSCTRLEAAYEAPDVSSYVFVSEANGDGDGDGIEETRIRHFRNAAGDKAFSMTTKDRLWAWSLEARAASGEADPDRNFVIRDSDCDGIFDEKYGLDDEFHVPYCLK